MKIQSNRTAFPSENVYGGKVIDVLSSLLNSFGKYLQTKSRGGMTFTRAEKQEDGSIETDIEIKSIDGKQINTKDGKYVFNFTFKPTVENGSKGDIQFHWDAQDGLKAGNAVMKDVQNTPEAQWDVIHTFALRLFGPKSRGVDKKDVGYDDMFEDLQEVADKQAQQGNEDANSSTKFSIKLKKIQGSTEFDILNINREDCTLTDSDMLDCVDCLLESPEFYEELPDDEVCYSIISDDDCIDFSECDSYATPSFDTNLSVILKSMYRTEMIVRNIKYNLVGMNMDQARYTAEDLLYQLYEYIDKFNTYYRRYCGTAIHPMVALVNIGDIAYESTTYDIYSCYSELVNCIDNMIDTISIEKYGAPDDIMESLMDFVNILGTKKDYLILSSCN